MNGAEKLEGRLILGGEMQTIELKEIQASYAVLVYEVYQRGVRFLGIAFHF